MAKRTVCNIKQQDYTSKEAFLKDVPKMREKGWHLIEKDSYGWSEMFGHGELDDDVWKYTAHYIKSDMM